MRLIHLDAVGGLAGDMFVAAMLDALPQLRARVLADVRAVLPAAVGTVDLAEGMSGAVRALRFKVSLDHPHDHAAGLAGYADIMARIAAAELAEGTAHHAGAIK